ncbi:hypothetical protein ACJX0J_011530, partial [Zea mays]
VHKLKRDDIFFPDQTAKTFPDILRIRYLTNCIDKNINGGDELGGDELGYIVAGHLIKILLDLKYILIHRDSKPRQYNFIQEIKNVGACDIIRELAGQMMNHLLNLVHTSWTGSLLHPILLSR